jgi:hypothetical protein
MHARAVGVEDAGDLDAQAVLANIPSLPTASSAFASADPGRHIFF